MPNPVDDLETHLQKCRAKLSLNWPLNSAGFELVTTDIRTRVGKFLKLTLGKYDAKQNLIAY